MKFCPACGSGVKENWKVCSKCGGVLKKIPEEARPESPKCHSCGKDVKENWKVCSGCGTKLGEKPKQADKEGKKSSKKKVIIIALAIAMVAIIILAIVGGMGGVFLIKKTGEESSGKVVEPYCKAPYIQVGTKCCLDKNGNGICDEDDKVVQPTTTITPTTTLKATTSVIDQTVSTISPAQTTMQPNAACGRDSDCGTTQYRCYGNYFCKEGSVYRNCRIDICHKPGKADAFCAKGAKDVLIDECGVGEVCVDERRLCQKTTISCSYPVKTTPSDSELLIIKKEYDQKINDYSFKMRSKSIDDDGCLEKVYVNMKKPVGVEDQTEITWGKNGVFKGDGISTGLVSVIDDSSVRIWVRFP